MKFDRKNGVYRRDNGQFIRRSELLSVVESSQKTLERKLEENMSRLVRSELARQANPDKWQRSKGAYRIEDFQRDAKAIVKEGVMQMALLGAGGAESADARIYGAAGYQLRMAYASIGKLGEKLAAGELTTGQAIDRARRLSLGTRQAFHRAEQLQKARDGFTLAKRTLAPGFKHCNECPALESGGYVPISEIVPVGTACSCGGNCKCLVTFKKAGPGEIDLSGGSLVEQVESGQVARTAEIATTRTATGETTTVNFKFKF